MSTPLVHQVKAMTDKEVEAATALCVRNYHGDISMKALFGGNWSVHGDYWRAVIKAGLLEGQVYSIKDSQGDIVSLGVWFEPGNDLFETEAQRAEGFYDFFAKLTPDTQNWWNDVCDPKMKAIAGPLWTKDEMARRWWCVNLVTDKPYRRRGYAKAITDTVLAKAAKTNTLLGLATAPEENVPKYKSMGFTERGNGRMPSPTGDFTVHIFSKEP